MTQNCENSCGNLLLILNRQPIVKIAFFDFFEGCACGKVPYRMILPAYSYRVKDGRRGRDRFVRTRSLFFDPLLFKLRILFVFDSFREGGAIVRRIDLSEEYR
ncbi:MAG: hypothetical protein C4530_18195 [Desulfobacteraceae bacterium]|nr:MAG: hypothetical protein C4530_18195 [Desulfobacteraceae bacterium]